MFVHVLTRELEAWRLELARLERLILTRAVCDISDSSADQTRTRSNAAMDPSSESAANVSAWINSLPAYGLDIPVTSIPTTCDQLQFSTGAELQRAGNDTAVAQQLFQWNRHPDSHIPSGMVLSDTTVAMPRQQSAGERSGFVQFPFAATLAVEESVSEGFSELEWPSILCSRESTAVAVLDLTSDVEFSKRRLEHGLVHRADNADSLETTTDVTEKEAVLHDGTIRRLFCTTTKMFRPTVTGEVITKKQDSDKDNILVSIDIDEKITLIPPNVSDISDPNITSDEHTDYYEDLVDGVPCRKKVTTVTLNALTTPTDEDSVIPEKQSGVQTGIHHEADEADIAEVSSHKTSLDTADDDLIQSRCEEHEEQQTLADGSTVKRHVTTTTFFRPVRQDILPPASDIGGLEIKVVEEIVRLEIEEQVTHLPKDITENSAKDIDMETSVEEYEEIAASGIPVKKTLIRTWPATLPDVPTLVREDEKFLRPVTGSGDIVKDKDIALSRTSQKIETSKRTFYEMTTQPSVDNSSGDITDCSLETVRDVTEEESVLDDGTIQRTYCTVTKRLRPIIIGEVIANEEDLIEGRVLVSVDIDERITFIYPNISDIDYPNVTSDEHVDYSENVISGGIPCRKKTTVIKFCTSLIPADESLIPEEERRMKDEHVILGQTEYRPKDDKADKMQTTEVGTQETSLDTAEDDVIQSRCKENEEKQTLSDGSTVKRHITTTTFFRPVKHGTRPPASDIGRLEIKGVEQIVRLEIKEQITHLPKGATDDFTKDINMETSVEEFEEITASGIPVKKTVIRTWPVTLPHVPTSTSEEIVAEEFSQPVCEVMSPDKVKAVVVPDMSNDANVDEKEKVEVETGTIAEPSLDDRVDTVRGEETTAEVTEKEEVLDDGTVQKTRCIVTKLFRPSADADVTAGDQDWNKDRVSVGIDVDEQITCIRPNVNDIADRDIIRDQHVDYSEDVIDGVLWRKKTTTITFSASVIPVKVKELVIRPEEKHEMNTEDVLLGEVEHKPRDDNTDETQTTEVGSHKTSLGTAEDDVIQSRCEECEEQQTLDDGSTVKRHVTITTFFRPVKQGSHPLTGDIGGLEIKLVEEVVRLEIREQTICLPRGVTEDSAKDIEMKTSVEEFEEMTTSGIPVKKTVIRTCPLTLRDDSVVASKEVVAEEFDLMSLEKDSTIALASYKYEEKVKENRMAEIEVVGVDEPSLDNRVDIARGEETATEVAEKEEVLDDGTVQKTRCIVTKLFRPSADADITAREQDSNKDGILVSIDVDEQIMLIPPDVSDVKDPSISSEEQIEYSEDVIDGRVAGRKRTTTITFSPSTLASEEDSVIPVMEKYVLEISPDVAELQREIDVVESLDTEVLSPKPVILSHDNNFGVTDVAHPSDAKVGCDTHVIPEVSVVSKPSTSVSVLQKLRRIGSDGEIVEVYGTDDSSYDAARLDDDADVAYCHFLSAADAGDLPVRDDTPAVQIYAKTVEEEPVVERSVEDFEETLDDGTVVRRRVTKTTQKTTVRQQVLVEGGRGDDATVAGPPIMQYTDVSVGGPGEVQSNVEESQEVLSDGTVVRRKVATTSHQQMVTERHMVSAAGHDSDSSAHLPPAAGDSDVDLVPVNGKQSPQSYIPELMKLSGTESDSTKEQGQLSCGFSSRFTLSVQMP